jgi:sialate O-acetylesterase
MKCFLLILIGAGLLTPSLAASDLVVSGMFRDHMTIQQGQAVPVWGWAQPGSTVTVSFGGQTHQGTADFRGSWTVRLDPLSADATPRELIVQGDRRLVIQDVVVGEVWFLSGQSNMAMLMSSSAAGHSRNPVAAERAESEIAAANDSLLRMIRIDNVSAERPRADVESRSGWVSWDSGHAGEFSALGYYLGRRLREELGVPVGLITCAWGGSGISAWTSAEALRSPALHTLWPEEVFEWRPNIQPSRLYNGMLFPAAPFAIAGFGWYQGETEATNYHNPFIARYLLAEMILDWRRLWEQPDLPFYIVQLPGLRNQPHWPIVRESQMEALRVPFTAMIPTIDIGDPADLHPVNKEAFGDRLADLILHSRYGRATWAGYPVFDHMVRESEGVRIFFRGGADSLMTSDGEAPRAFALAGTDQAFIEASASIEGSTILVESPAVPDPVAVRYAWEGDPKVNVVNAAGLPLAPFRSDEWPVHGQMMVGEVLPVKERLRYVTSGKSLFEGNNSEWTFNAVGGIAEELPMYFNVAGDSLQFRVRGFSLRPNLPSSPPFFWSIEPETSSDGLTIEMRLHPGRIGEATRGFVIEANLPQADGSLREYIYSVFPLQLRTFQNVNEGRASRGLETRVILSDMPNETALFRMAIRPDGVAQLYRDGDLVGTTTGVHIEGSAASAPYVRIGKITEGGEWIATLHHVAYDPTGAFAPPGKASQAASFPPARSRLERHPLETGFQNGIQEIRVLLPDSYETNRAFRTLYVLPVASGPSGGGLNRLQEMDVHNDHDLIVVEMTFERTPWYGDHVDDAAIRQASYLRDFVVPFVESRYSTLGNRDGRLLLGFSKSGWGAFSLILRDPDFYGYAAAWDAPFLFDEFHFGMESVFGTLARLKEFRPDLLLEDRSSPFRDRPRLVLAGENLWGAIIPPPEGGSHTETYRRLLNQAGVRHTFVSAPGPHRWDSSWMSPTLAALIELAQ